MKPRNQGAALLARTGETQTDIARAAKVSTVTAHHWMTGEKKPSKARRAQLKQLYGIATATWDRPPDRRASSSSRAARNVDDEDAVALGGAFEQARKLLAIVTREITRLEEQQDPPSRTLRELSGTLAQIMKMTGEYDIARRMLHLPLWKRIEAALEETLAPYPEAARAVAERFEALEKEERG